MSDNPLFRKAALDKASSPERLDVLMQVTSPKGWLALWTTGGLLVGAIAWGFWGSIPDLVQGRGILVRGEFREIRASSDGTLVDFGIGVNDRVSIDDVVAEIAPQGVGGQERDAWERYQDLSRECEIARTDAASAIAGHDQTIIRTQGEIETTREQLVVAEVELAEVTDLVERQLLPEPRQQQAQNTVNQLTRQINSAEAQIASLGTAIAGENSRSRNRCSQSDSARREWQAIQEQVGDAKTAVSAVSGRVTQVNKSVGDIVRNGEVLAIVESEGSMQPVVYVEARDGARLAPGMEVRIYTDEVSREEYGYMVASIETVSETAVSVAAIQLVTRNPEVSAELYGNSAKFEVRVALVTDSSSPSGFEWSTSEGPPHQIDSGNLADVEVVIERVRPIIYVMPFLRGRFGLG
jgi:HlyD family secretion protein